MVSAVGFTGLVGLGTIASRVLIKASKRRIGDLVADATVEEVHNDDLEITDHPVDQGTTISDHAFMRPREVIVKFGFSNSSVPTAPGFNPGNIIPSSLLSGSSPKQIKTIYDKLLTLQVNRTLITVVTGKRTYKNALIRSLRVHTDKTTEETLMVEATFREMILASTQVVTVAAPPEDQKDKTKTQPPITSGTKSLSPATTINQEAAAKAVSP